MGNLSYRTSNRKGDDDDDMSCTFLLSTNIKVKEYKTRWDLYLLDSGRKKVMEKKDIS